MRKILFFLFIFCFTVLGNTKSADITIDVRNVDNSLRSNARVKLYKSNYTIEVGTQYTNSNGTVNFTGQSNGDYQFEVYYTPSVNDGPVQPNEEFWGSGTANLAGGSSIIVFFTRIQPYINNAPAFSPSTFSIGSTTNGTFSVRNGLPYTTNSQVSIWIDRSQSSTWDIERTSSTQSISGTNTASFQFNGINPTNKGTYKFYAVVKSLVNNRYVITDQYNWTTAFTVTCPSLATPTTPLPGSTSSPGPILIDLTPTLTWNGPSNGIYHVQIWNASTSNPTSDNVIYGFESPSSSPGHCIFGLSHTIPDEVLEPGRQYKWRVHRNEPCGECESPNTSLMYFQTASDCSPPNIISHPQAQTTICNNEDVTLEIDAEGTNLSYQWQRYNGSSWNNVGGDNSTYSTNNSGTYHCIVSGECGSPQTSDNAVLVDGGSCSGPVARFSASPRVIVAGQIVNFTNESLNSLGVAWEIFRVQTNGTTNQVYTTSANNFSYSLLSPGCYKIVLTASDGSTSNTAASSSCYITVNANLAVSVPENVSYDKNYLTGIGGDPVILSSGCFDISFKDLSVTGIKTEVVVERRYLSKNAEIGVFGKGWFFDYATWIDVSNPYEWRLHHGDGHITYHVPYQNGETRSLYAGMFDSLYYSVEDGIYTYTYQEKGGIKWKFNNAGKLIGKEDLDGNEIVCNYSDGRLINITAPGSRYINFSYNSHERINTAVSNGGRQVSYYYNADGSLLDSVTIGPSTTRFVYDAYGLTEVVDPNGNRVIKNVYNNNSQVIEQYDAFNHPTLFNYNVPTANQTTVINPLLHTRVATHDNNYHLTENLDELDNKRKYRFNSVGLLDTIINELGYIKKLQYDSYQNLIKVVDEMGYFDSTSYAQYARPEYSRDKEGNVSRITYTNTGNLRTLTLPNTGIVQFFYDDKGQDTLTVDAEGNVEKKEYFSNGDLHRLIKPGSVETFNYDLDGRISSMVNGKGYPIEFEYNHFDQVTRIVDAMGFDVVFDYDLNGNLIYFKDKQGNVTRREYDAKDRLIKQIEPYNHISSFYYDPVDQVVKIRDANNNVKLFAYDKIGRLKTISDSALGTFASYSYDEAGNIKVFTDGRGKEWKINYDDRNLPVAYINPLNKQKTLTYNGNGQIIQRKDELGRSSFLTYNSLGLPNVATDAYGNTVSHAYDLNGNLKTVIDAIGNTYRWTYDGNNQIKTFDEGYGAQSFTWDSAGNMIRFVDAENKETELLYNPNNENIAEVYENDTIKKFALSPNGWIEQAANINGAIKFQRDNYGQTLRKIGFYNDTVFYKRDSIGNVIELNYGRGKSVSYTYNSLGLSTSVKDWNNNFYTLRRNLNGSLDSIIYPNGNRIAIAENDAGQVITWKDFLNASDTSLLVMDSLVRNDAGEIISNLSPKLLYPTIVDQSNNGKYDVADRIKVYGTTSFQTGANGNIVSATSPLFNNTYSYSSNGNTISGNLTSYNHNNTQQLNSFDPFNNRVRVANKATYCIDEELVGRPLSLSEMNDGNEYNLASANIYTPEGLLLARDSSGIVQYFLPDVNGNIVALTNNESEVTDTYSTDPFGDYFTHVGNSTQPFTFLGMYGVQRDSSGLYYDWARYYDAHLGRFLSKDQYPMNTLQTQGVNGYTYGLNNPNSLVDIDGMKPVNVTTRFDFDAEYKRNTWWQRFASSEAGDKIIKVLDFFASGRFVGTGFGIEARDYYEQVYISSVVNNKPNALALLGVGLSSLWTPENYLKTLNTLTLKTNFSGSTATKYIGKTGLLKILDMRQTKGRIIKKAIGLIDATSVVKKVYEGFYK